MKRVAIVARSEELGASLAAILRARPEIEVVAVTTSEDEVPSAADVVIVARETSGQSVATRAARADSFEETLLTSREREVLALLADGLGNKQIAARLGISPNTVKTHLELLFDKLGVSTRAEAVAKGVKRGLLLL